MAHGDDWLPPGQDEFVDWSQRFVYGIDDAHAELGIASTVNAALKTKQATTMAAWTELQVMGKAHATSVAREELIAAHKKFFRGWVAQYIRGNPNLTDTIRAQVGLPIPDTTYTHIVVGDRRVAFTLEPDGVSQVKIICMDEQTKERKITYGMSGIVAFYVIGPAPVTDITQLTESELITKAIHVIRASPNQRSQWLSITVCWQSQTGEKGPWAAIQSTVIP